MEGTEVARDFYEVIRVIYDKIDQGRSSSEIHAIIRRKHAGYAPRFVCFRYVFKSVAAPRLH